VFSKEDVWGSKPGIHFTKETCDEKGPWPGYFRPRGKRKKGGFTVTAVRHVGE